MTRRLGAILWVWAMSLGFVSTAWATDDEPATRPTRQEAATQAQQSAQLHSRAKAPNLARFAGLLLLHGTAAEAEPAPGVLEAAANMLDRAGETWAPREEGLSFLVAPVFGSITPGGLGVRGTVRLRF